MKYTHTRWKIYIYIPIHSHAATAFIFMNSHELGPSIPEMLLSKNMTLKIQGHGWVKGQGHMVDPTLYQLISLLFRVNWTIPLQWRHNGHDGITSLRIVYWTVYSGTDQTKHQSSASLAFVRGIHRWPVNSPHKWPVTWKMFSFDDVIMHSWDMTWHLQEARTRCTKSLRKNIQQKFGNLKKITCDTP